MKIKNIVAYGSLALSAAALIITVRHQKYNEARFEQQQNNIKSLETEIDNLKTENIDLQNQLNNISLEDMIDQLVYDLQTETKNTNINITYHKKEGLFISIENQENNEKYKLSDAFYRKLNQLIICGGTTDLSLFSLGDEIDFSRVTMPNLKNINFYQCNEKMDCSSFTQKYNTVVFTNTSELVAMSFLHYSDCSDAIVNCNNIYKYGLTYYEDIDSFMDIGLFANYMIEKDIPIKKLIVKQWSYFDFNSDIVALPEEDIDLLSQVNTKSLSIINTGSENPIDLNLKLNPNIEELNFCFVQNVFSWVSDIVSRELHNIQIQSDSSFLEIKFQTGTITDDTHFDLPSSSSVCFEDVEYRDTMPFYDLENVQMIEYQHSDASQTHEYDEEVRIVHIVGNEFDDFINELKDYHRNPKKVYNN